jgi:DNA-binding NarL/FixJ family response regulator
MCDLPPETADGVSSHDRPIRGRPIIWVAEATTDPVVGRNQNTKCPGDRVVSRQQLHAREGASTIKGVSPRYEHTTSAVFTARKRDQLICRCHRGGPSLGISPGVPTRSTLENVAQARHRDRKCRRLGSRSCTASSTAYSHIHIFTKGYHLLPQEYYHVDTGEH